MTIIDEIRIAQRDAGEQVVMKNLDEVWLNEQLNRIAPQRGEIGEDADRMALEVLVFELRDQLAAQAKAEPCKHLSVHIHWDYVQCKKCAAVKLDGAGDAWHPSLAHARKFKNGG